MNHCTAWGMYPLIDCNRFTFKSTEALKEIIAEKTDLIPFGNGRSYGDSALGENIIDVKSQNYFPGLR